MLSRQEFKNAVQFRPKKCYKTSEILVTVLDAFMFHCSFFESPYLNGTI